MRGGSAHWAVAALVAFLLAGCSAAPVSNPVPCPGPALPQLLSFKFPSSLNPTLPADCDGMITDDTVEVEVPFLANRCDLVAAFAAEGTRVLVDEVPQVSGETANHFCPPPVYTIVSADGVSTDYAVRVAGLSEDAFDRTDSEVVGNDWREIELGAGPAADASIASSALVLTGGNDLYWKWAGIQRDFPRGFSSPLRVEVSFRCERGALLAVQAWDEELLHNCRMYVSGSSLAVSRDGVLQASTTVTFDYDHPYLLTARVDGALLSVTLTNQLTGATDELTWTDPAPRDSFAHIALYGGGYAANIQCSTTIDRVAFWSD